jgi:hypothetical protein
MFSSTSVCFNVNRVLSSNNNFFGIYEDVTELPCMAVISGVVKFIVDRLLTYALPTYALPTYALPTYALPTYTTNTFSHKVAA